MRQSSCIAIIEAMEEQREANPTTDDLLVIAVTPICTIDLEQVPESQRDELYKGIWKFLSKAGRAKRIRTCLREVISSALRNDWLPEVVEEEKEKMLKCLPLIENFDADGMPVLKEKLLAAYKRTLASGNYAKPKYGNVESWSKDKSTSRGRAVLPPIVKDPNLYGNLQSFIDQYTSHWEYVVERERYKWESIRQFQDNFDFDAEDFAAMLERSIPSNNLLNGPHYFSRTVLLNNAKATPEVVKTLFEKLFNENTSLDVRVKEYIDGFESMNTTNRESGVISSSTFSTYQDDHAVSTLLMLKSPTQHYLYKFSIINRFIDITGIHYPKMRGGFKENLSRYEEICEDIKEIILKDEHLVRLHDETYGSQYGYNLLVQDFIYSIVRYLDFWKSVDNEELGD